MLTGNMFFYEKRGKTGFYLFICYVLMLSIAIFNIHTLLCLHPGIKYTKNYILFAKLTTKMSHL